MEALNSLFPILVLVLLGILSRRIGIFAREHVKTLSSFVYYFALPALFYAKLSETDIAALDPDIVLGSVLPVILIMAILYLLKLLGRLTKDQFILLGLSISLGSYAFFGIAFFETLYDGRWFSSAVVAASAFGIVGIILSLTLFEYANSKGTGPGFVLKALRNPLIIAIFLGVISSLLGFRIGAVNSALTLLGKTASGIAIFVLGIFLHDNFSLQAARRSLSYSLFRIISLPIATYLLILVGMGGGPDLSRFLFLQSGVPAAISLVVFAERYDYKLPEVTGMVILTSVFSFVVLIILSLMAGVLF
jgi:malonate transporter and related proteins